MYQVNFNVNNALNTPSIAADTFANRPTVAATGAVYIATDTGSMYRYNGTTWSSIGGGGISGSGTINKIPVWTSASALGDSDLVYTVPGAYPNKQIISGCSFESQYADPTINGNAAGYIVRRTANNTIVATLLGLDTTVTAAKPIFNTYAQDDYYFKIFGTANNYHAWFKNGNVVINGYTDAGFKLDVQGNTRVYGILSVNDASAYGMQFNPSANGPLIIYGSYPSFRCKTTLGGADTKAEMGSTGPTGYLNLYYGTTSDIYIAPNGSCYMGSASNYAFGKASAPTASCLVEFNSTSLGVRMPVMTTTQKNAIATPASGLMIFDSTLGKMCIYTGSAWQTITSV